MKLWSEKPVRKTDNADLAQCAFVAAFLRSYLPSASAFEVKRIMSRKLQT